MPPRPSLRQVCVVCRIQKVRRSVSSLAAGPTCIPSFGRTILPVASPEVRALLHRLPTQGEQSLRGRRTLQVLKKEGETRPPSKTHQCSKSDVQLLVWPAGP